MSGLIGLGQSHRQEAMGGLHDAAALEGQRDATNKSLKAAHSAQRANSMGSGAVTGAMIGAKAGGTAAAATTAGGSVAAGTTAGAAGGPLGMAVGALAGLAAGYFLS